MAILMGTRADFYIGVGAAAEWLGSIAWDGYPHGLSSGLLDSGTEQEFRDAVVALSKTRDDFTAPKQGWPWPWTTSATTDYAYCWDFGHRKVRVFNFGEEVGLKPEWPNMADKQKVALGHRSGLFVIEDS